MIAIILVAGSGRGTRRFGGARVARCRLRGLVASRSSFSGWRRSVSGVERSCRRRPSALSKNQSRDERRRDHAVATRWKKRLE